MAKQTIRKTTTRMDDTPTYGSSPQIATKARNKATPTQEQIRARAFEIYLRRKGGPGDAHSDWVQAERELSAELNR